MLVNGLTSYAVSSQYSLTRHTIDYLIDNPTWPEDYKLFNVEMAWTDYLFTGNDEVLRRRYENLKVKLNRGKGADSFNGAEHDFKGNLKNGHGVDNFDQQVGLVTNDGLIDWPIPERDGFVEGKFNTPFNAIFYHAYLVMGKIASLTNHQEDADKYQERAKRLKREMIARLYDAKSGRFYDSLNADLSINKHTSHHSTAYALCYGIYDSPEMADKMSHFVANDGQFIGSVYFIYFMLKGLIDSGHADDAMRLLTNPDDSKDAKTFAAIIKNVKATITPEAWSNHYKPNMTMSHPWGAVPGLTIVQGIMGIVPLKPGFEDFQIMVQAGDVKHLSVTAPSARGLIKVDYQQNESQKALMVNIPMNTTAHIVLPENSNGLMVTNGDYAIDYEKDKTGAIVLPSGKYELSYRN